jgi:putative membrane protein
MYEKQRSGGLILRFVKGMFIGSGFILPGVSGGALAAVFGIYERLISFLANLKKDFKKNLLFFIPVGLGMATGVFLLAFPISFLLDQNETKTYILWFFIGCILGTLPALFRQASKKGWKLWHIGLLVATCAAAYLFLRAGESIGAVTFSQGFFTWILAGVLIGLGVVVPGLSPSNLLIYLKLNEHTTLYQGMTDGIKGLDFGVIIPLLIGVAACVLLLSKLMEYIFSRAYAALYHAILGFVIASTLIIVPMNFNYISVGGLICLVVCGAGIALALFMSGLEDKYKPGD